MRYRMRSMPRPLRRIVLCATTMACDWSSSRRSERGSSWLRINSAPDQTRAVRVAPAKRKKRMVVSMGGAPVPQEKPSYADVGYPPNDQDADAFRKDRVGEGFAAGGVGPQQADIVGLEDPEANRYDYREQAQ